MAERKGWQRTDISVMESFSRLSVREQTAVRIAVDGLRAWRISDQEPKPMRVVITEERPFDLRGFAQVLHELGVGITDGIRQEDENTVVFQPKPYNQESLTREREKQRRRAMLDLDEETLARIFHFFSA